MNRNRNMTIDFRINGKHELRMAIAELEQQPTDTWSIKDVANTFKKHGLIRAQEPTFDDECQKDMDEAWEQIQKKRKRIPVTLDLTLCDDAISRRFEKIVVEYPTICTYPEYQGKPYFSIQYEENGEHFVGYGTYKPEVLTRYIKEYFMPSVTQKSGKWIDYRDDGFVECPFCGHATNCEDDIDELHYCFYCGAELSADMRGDTE